MSAQLNIIEIQNPRPLILKNAASKHFYPSYNINKQIIAKWQSFIYIQHHLTNISLTYFLHVIIRIFFHFFFVVLNSGFSHVLLNNNNIISSRPKIKPM